MLTRRRLLKSSDSGGSRIWITLVLFVIWALAAQSAQPTASAASWEQKWKELVTAAKKEGRLVLFGSTDTTMRRQIPAAFKDRFGITVEYMGGSGRSIVPRIQAEQQVGQHYFDVVIAGTSQERLLEGNMLDPIRPVLLHPDVADPSKWTLGKLYFLDAQQQYILRLSMYASILRAINTDYVKPEEASWEGLLNPKWKGKIASMDPIARGAGQGRAQYILYHFGEDYFTKLYVGQRVVFTRENRQLADWIARGTYPIALGVPGGEYFRLKKDGFPVKILLNTKDVPGFTTAGRGYLGLVRNAPHPNAAKLFVNWLMTKDGHTVYNRSSGVPGMRSDLDYPWAPKATIVQPGFKYLDSDSPDFRENLESKLDKRIKELLSK